MTEYIRTKQKCIICGHINFVRLLASSHSRETNVSLDSRIGREFSAFNEELNMCEKCHYVNFNLNELIPNLNKDIVLSSFYKEIYKIFSENGLLCELFLAGNLYQIAGNYMEAGLFYLSCAWVCDDGKDFESANFFRNYCSICLNEYLKKVNDLEISIILIDTYRRMGNFKKSKKLASKILDELDKNESENVKEIITYEIKLCEASDKEIHFVDEVKNRKD